MAQTATGLLPLLREAWTAEEAVKQFEAGNGPLARIRKVKSTMIGKQAQVPIHKGRNLGGYTSVGAAGGNLNTAGNQQVDQATYTLVYHWLSVALDASALMQAGGSNQQSIVEGKVLEIENGIENIKHQSVRQLMTNGDSIVAACASGGASTTISLVASPSGTAWGYDAIVRGWLGVGSVIDVGTTADTDALLTAGTVTGVSESASAPTITTATSITTVAGTHFVYIANPNSATAANPEINGLRNLINTSGAVGGLNPSTAGQEFWQAASQGHGDHGVLAGPRAVAAARRHAEVGAAADRRVDGPQAAGELLQPAAEPGPLHRRHDRERRVGVDNEVERHDRRRLPGRARQRLVLPDPVGLLPHQRRCRRAGVGLLAGR
jgi:hypothetical protein